MTEEKVIRVAVAGANGRMGQAAVKTIEKSESTVLAGVLVRTSTQVNSSDIGTSVYDDPLKLIDTEKPDVWLDLTVPERVVQHVDIALANGVYPVVGATGYTQEDLERWDALAKEQGIGGIACPNFAMGALLMMRFAREAAQWMQRAEIIELHHDQKQDMPSGTAIRTANQMQTDYEVPIHSVRLPGLVAHQEIIFGGTAETLTIRHDSMSRESFMPGVLMACQRVMELKQMVYGLENLLF